MDLGGLRRGLAASAVGALALTGLTALAPARAADGATVRLVSQLGAVVTTRPEGAQGGELVRLVAERSPGTSVEFQVNPDPRASATDAGWRALPSPLRSAGGYVSQWWDPLADDPELVGTRVAVRAVGTAGSGEQAYSTQHDVLVAPPSDAGHAVRATFSGGYFVQPYASSGRTASLAGVAGTTTATGGSVALQEWRPEVGAYRGLTNAAVAPADVKGHRGGETVAVAGGAFAAVLPVAAFDAQDGTQVAVRATRDGEDVAVGALHRQRIDGIQYRSPETTSRGTTLDLLVLSDQGDPVAGAEVRRGDGTLLGYTGGAGTVTATQPNGTSASYYVNTDDGDGFDPGLDHAVEYAAPPFVRAAAGLVPALADGPAFDTREYAPGDVALQVVDQDGRPFPGAREVQYRLHADGTTPPALTSATTDTRGRLVLPFTAPRAAGTWHLQHALADHPVLRWDRFVSGRATVTLAPTRAQAASGGTQTFTGRLTVAGRPLAGRAVDAGYRRGVESVPGTGADAGILVAGQRRLRATVATRADGTFSVTVGDRREKGSPSEQGGTLTVTARTSGATAAAGTRFGARKGSVRPRSHGTSAGGTDRLVVRTSPAAAGERVRLLARIAGRWRAVATATLDRRGRATMRVRDRNGARATDYRARLVPSARAAGSRSPIERVR